MRKIIIITLLSALGLSALALGGCGGSNSSSATQQKGKGTVIHVTVHGDKVTPNGERVKAKLGAPITIKVDADRKGELHVHSTPEHELAYGVGKTTLHVRVKNPGIIDIEDHKADVVVVQLEVS